ncbi:uncharacterized protein LOC141984528 [Natator depressus]|uniref:uncharacterized protein LOC141984528 n=1 Tax=Natator depressus TaxID=27790 RepID=UPI003EBF6FFC
MGNGSGYLMLAIEDEGLVPRVGTGPLLAPGIGAGLASVSRTGNITSPVPEVLSWGSVPGSSAAAKCRVKLKELRQAYQKTREANGRSGSEPQTCRFYDELHAILGGSATTTPAVLFDSFNGDGGNTEAGFGDEEDDDDDEVVDSSQQASGETGFPDSQELFLTLDLEPVPPEPTQGCLLDPAGGEGTSAACVSMITGSSPSQRLVKIRKKKKRTRDEMFSELMLSSHTDRAQTNAWRQIMSDCRKAQNDQEERWRAEESKWRAEERAEARMWRQRDERRQDSMLRLLEDQTTVIHKMASCMGRDLRIPSKRT